jgi:hypothetical protein
MMAVGQRWTTRIATAAAAATLAAGAGSAHAGRSHFGWVPATEVVPERGVELETWILERNGVGEDDEVDTTPDETSIWWTTVVGITDRVELAVPIEIKSLHGAGSGGATLLYGFGAEARWRLVSPDREEAGPVAPALRVGFHRLINQRDRVRASAGFGLGADVGERVHMAADVGAVSVMSEDDASFELRPAAGVSLRVLEQLRVGGEVYAELTLRGDDEGDWVAAGPNLAWTHGRFWITAAFPVGVIDIRAAPRINWAVAF